jgi:hypothetical protein
VCVCVSMSVIKCNCDPLHLRVRKRSQTKKETKKESARGLVFDEIRASEITGRYVCVKFSNYDAANTLVRANRPRLK